MKHPAGPRDSGWFVCHKADFGGESGGFGGFGEIPDVSQLFPGVPIPQQGVAGGNMEALPPGVSISQPSPVPGGEGGGLMPWNYNVPNPEIPNVPGQHVDFESFPGGRGVAGGGGRRNRRRKQRRQNRFFDQLSSGRRPEQFWRDSEGFKGGGGFGRN